jgi:hypothetical protein
MSTVPPGWYADPSNQGGVLRWWDGYAWTAHTQQAMAAAPGSFAAPAPAYRGAPAQPSFAKRNSLSLVAIAIVAVYVLLALTTRVVLLGIFPVIMAVRATRSKEQLAPIAVVAAAIAVGIAFIALK